MASLELRNGTYRVVFRYGGQKFARSLKTNQASAANLALARLEDNLRRVELGSLVLEAGVDIPTALLTSGVLKQKPKLEKAPLLGELLDLYVQSIPKSAIEASTWKMLATHLAHLKRLLGVRTRPSSFSLDHLQAYVNARSEEKGLRGKPLSPTTIKKELATLNDLVDTLGGPAARDGWDIWQAYAINDLGQITGYAVKSDDWAAYIVDPISEIPFTVIPEPSGLENEWTASETINNFGEMVVRVSFRPGQAFYVYSPDSNTYSYLGDIGSRSPDISDSGDVGIGRPGAIYHEGTGHLQLKDLVHPDDASLLPESLDVDRISERDSKGFSPILCSGFFDFNTSAGFVLTPEYPQ